ncbi:putative mitochondrial voltage-dependent anion-selective channel [Leptomonas pyrrhocoris]|uniref:Putative mitochondrial voltage-dependent anion-selective channel n=1 Tax=Leptomonas pyrrhocoris TaxID=157538 RepID=A0A0M9FSD2_LEPPY|nr:putative mitochondrial voltage-dependent anion-selective channel [Leptomonas pyrrhocoris]XP_015653396.1 putative mitochondrial voltage-dependent anion-selective channel [Leptomonas pyrrhocoris]XP_015653397.1 putative mitochondrial voltage-dependent anion-selective channel [Leptomonas pyrrhocoris]XP_015653398.1 putative mitochondrial voltage-dependent anion-selective channel [Leptomonas pyrrhocoris]KPA74956.1 putative mitochondrial voltage-dependent anion-selective channel [Leptomonas pyrrhoc|eukprot:XP_015653395.1 putative mitochondrial voltage-dependent anion-selective channel [Leptomonas pyrrhocoris]
MSRPAHTAPAAAKQYSTPSLFKDYNKATKDMLTKNYPAPGNWTVECKYKGPKDTFFVNPQVSNEGKITTDIEYVAECNGGVKISLTPDIAREIKGTAHYTLNGHKVEVALQRNGDSLRYEVSHETCVALSKLASINEKITPEQVELGMGIDVAPNCQVGCGAVYDRKANDCSWNVGCRWAEKGYEVAIRTNRFRTYQSSASLPVNFTFRGNPCTVRGAVEVECGHGRGDKGTGVTFGVEATCPVLPANTIKARVNRNKEWAVAYIAKMADNWTVSVSMDKNLKPGVLLTHS